MGDIYYTKETFVSKKGEKALELLPMTPLCHHRLIVNIIIIMITTELHGTWPPLSVTYNSVDIISEFLQTYLNVITFASTKKLPNFEYCSAFSIYKEWKENINRNIHCKVNKITTIV